MNALMCFYCSGEHVSRLCYLERFSPLEFEVNEQGKSNLNDIVDHLGHLPLERLDEFLILERALTSQETQNNEEEFKRIVQVTSEFIQIIRWIHIESFVKCSEEIHRFAAVSSSISDELLPNLSEKAQIQTEAMEYYRLGVQNFLGYNDNEAIKNFNQAQHLMPDDPRIYSGMGLVYIRNDRLELAIKCFEAAKQSGGDPEGHYRLLIARSHFCLGEITEAIRIVQEVSRQQPENLEAIFHFVCYHAASQANLYRSAANFATSLSADEILDLLKDLIQKDRRYFLRVKFSRDLSPIRHVLDPWLSEIYSSTRKKAAELIETAAKHPSDIEQKDFASIRAHKAFDLASEALEHGGYFSFLDVIERTEELLKLSDPSTADKKHQKTKKTTLKDSEQKAVRISKASALIQDIEVVKAALERQKKQPNPEDLYQIAFEMEALSSKFLTTLQEASKYSEAAPPVAWRWMGFLLGLAVSGVIIAAVLVIVL